MLWPTLEYLSAQFTEPSSDAPVLKIEEHEEAAPWQDSAGPWRTMLVELPCYAGRSSTSPEQPFPTWHLGSSSSMG